MPMQSHMASVFYTPSRSTAAPLNWEDASKDEDLTDDKQLVFRSSQEASNSEARQEGQATARKQHHTIDKVSEDLKFCINQSAEINQNAREFIKEAREQLYSPTAATQRLDRDGK